MKNTDKKLKALSALNDEINQQIIYVPNRVDNLEDLFEYEEIGEQSLFLFHVYKSLNELYHQFLSETHKQPEEILSEKDKQTFKERARKEIKNIRDRLILKQKYLLSEKKDNEKEAEYDALIKNEIEKKIKGYFNLHIDELIEKLSSGESLSIENDTLEKIFIAQEKLGDYREQYNKQTISSSLFFTPKSDNNLLREQSKKLSFMITGIYMERIKSDTGQCGEHVALALIKILRSDWLEPNDVIEAVVTDHVSNGAFTDNHVFLVLNRDPNSDLSDMSTWGEDAIVFDSWKRVAFKAKDYLSHRYISINGEKLRWTSTKFTYTDKYALLYRLTTNDLFFCMTEHHSAEKLIPKLMDEHQLASLEEPTLSNTKTFLYQLLDEVKPANFPLNVQIFLSHGGSKLTQVIAGFSTPVISINLSLLKNLDLSNTNDIDELKFALAQAMLAIKNHGVGIADTLLPNEQFNLDKQALNISGNGEAALRYLRRAIQFEKNSEENERPLTLPSVYGDHDNIGCQIISASYEQRIKNLMTAFAADKSLLEKKSQKEYETTSVTREIENIAVKKKTFYTDEFNKQNSVTDKIRYLQQQLTTLKEYEFLPYEMTLNPSKRVQEFCKLLNNLEINWENQLQIEAIDALINQAITLRVPGFDRIYFAVLHQPYYLDSRDKEIELRPLGLFKSCQAALTSFTQATDFQTAQRTAASFLQIYIQLRNHFARLRTDNIAYDHLHNYRKDHHGAIPVKEDRFFGSAVGSKIRWQGFKKENAERIFDYYDWAKKDETGMIANMLWTLGFNKNTIILSKMPPQLLEESLLTTVIGQPLAIQVKHSSALDSLHENEQLNKNTIVKFFAKKHILQVDMFDGPAPFEEKFKQFFDANWIALRYPNDKMNINDDNEAVRFLLEKFTNIALHGLPEEKNVVKSFFLGREDKRDLKSLINGTIPDFFYSADSYKLSLNSPYFQFCFYQRYKNKQFQLFTNEECITLLNKINKNTIPLELLFFYFDLSYPPLTHNDLEIFIQKIEKYKIFGCDTRELFLAYLKKHGDYSLFSQDAAQLIRISAIDEFLAHAGLYNHLIWQDPTAEMTSKMNTLDLITIYRACEQIFLFPSFAQQQQLGNFIIEKIKALPTHSEKMQALESLLFCRLMKGIHPLGDIMLRDKIIDLWVQSVVEEYGYDNGSNEYLEKMKEIILRIKENVIARDIEVVFSKLANAVNAQRNVSEFIGVQLEAENYFFSEQERGQQRETAISFLGKATTFLGNDAQDQEQALDFISHAISFDSATQFTEYLVDHNKAHELFEKIGWSGKLFYDDTRDVKIKKTRDLLYTFYYGFWDRSLIERAILIDYLTIPASKVLSEEQINQAYEAVLGYVTKRLFPAYADRNSDDAVALALLKAYLDTANKYERSILLSGLIVVSNTTSQQQNKISVGKKFALLCEHMGPAYIKLAQAIHSHPATPEHIRQDLGHIKGKANPPHRWQLWRLLLEVLPDEDIKQIKRVGNLLGSASYNLALEVELQNGQQVVLLLLREDAEKQAKEGFSHLKAAINACQHHRMDGMRHTVVTMLDKAQELSQSEMDYHISDEQNKIAKKMYQLPLTVRVDNTAYNVLMHPANTLKSGYGYRFIERVYGDEFNDLPNNTPQEKTIKKAIAAAVMTTELINLLHGGSFDSDRHGNQYRAVVDDENKTIFLGLYDFGEMELKHPTESELHLLANVIHELEKPWNLFGLSLSRKIDSLLSKQVDQAIAKGMPADYLMRIRKGLLALQDFQKCLSSAEMADIVLGILQHHKESIHPILYAALSQVIDKLSFVQSVHHGARSFFNLFKATSKKHSLDDNGENKEMDKKLRMDHSSI